MLAAEQFRASVSQEKVRAVLKRHRLNTLEMVKESMEKGWKTWSKQAAKLQMLRAGRENRKTQGPGFFKMTDEAIAIVQEDIAKDLYDMATCHREEGSWIMQGFDKHGVNTTVHLDNLVAEQWRQTPVLRAPEAEKPRPLTEDSNKSDEANNIDDEDEDDNDEAENEGDDHEQ